MAERLGKFPAAATELRYATADDCASESNGISNEDAYPHGAHPISRTIGAAKGY